MLLKFGNLILKIRANLKRHNRIYIISSNHTYRPMRVRVAEYLSYFTNGNIILRIGHNRITALPSPFIAESFLLPNKKIATTQLYCWVKKITVQKIAYSSNVQHDTLRCRCGIPSETKRNRSPFGTELNSEMVLIETKMIVFYLHIEARRQLQFSLYEDN